MSNITKSFADFLDTEGYGIVGTDIYIGGIPLNAPDPCWWIVSSGGNNKSKNQTGEKQKNYIISVFYRSLNAQDVYDTLEQLETFINQDNCIDIPGYDIIETEATAFPADQDIDNEDRTVGLVQITLTVYL